MLNWFKHLNIRLRIFVVIGFAASLTIIMAIGSIAIINLLNKGMNATSTDVQENIDTNVANLSIHQQITDLTSSILAANSEEELLATRPENVLSELKREYSDSNFDWSMEGVINDFYATKEAYLSTSDNLNGQLASFLKSAEQLSEGMSRSLTDLTRKNAKEAETSQNEISQSTTEGVNHTLEELSSTMLTTLDDVVLVLQIRGKVLELDLGVRQYLDNPTADQKTAVDTLLEELSTMLENIPENVAGPFEVMEFTALNDKAREVLQGDGGILAMKTANAGAVSELGETLTELDERLSELADNTVFDGTAALKDYLSNVSSSLGDSLNVLINNQKQVNQSFNASAELERIGARINQDLFQIAFRIQTAALARNQESLAELDRSADTLLSEISDMEGKALQMLRAMNANAEASELESNVNSIIEDIRGESGVLATTRSLVENYEATLQANHKIEQSLNTASEGMIRSFAELSSATQTRMETNISSSEGYLFIFMVAGVIIVAITVILGYIIGNGIAKLLGTVVYNLFNLSERLSHSAATMAQSSEEQASMSSEQAASLEESSSTIEEISSMAAKNAEASRDAAGISSEVQNATINSTQKMASMTRAMDEINKASEQIGNIIRTIDEIAFQTNILALNAAVEAARAGEAGAGFAVVADEVRNLALKCKNAAQETEEIIARNHMRTKEGVVICNDVGGALDSINDKIGTLNALIAGIAEATQEQSTGLEQINRGIAETSSTTQKNAALAQQGASASQELNHESRDLLMTLEGLSRLAGVSSVGSNGSRASASVEGPERHASLDQGYTGAFEDFSDSGDDHGRFLS